MYEYAAQVVKVVDGDTINVEVDLGFDIDFGMPLRFAGINAPEHGTPEGDAATAYLTQLLQVMPNTGTTTNFQPLTIRTVKDHKEKYGRYLAYIFVGPPPGGAPAPLLGSINQAMLDSGHAVPYSGGIR